MKSFATHALRPSVLFGRGDYQLIPSLQRLYCEDGDIFRHWRRTELMGRDVRQQHR